MKTGEPFPVVKREEFNKDDLDMMRSHGKTDNVDMITTARELIFRYVKERLEKTDTHVTFSYDEVYVVWFCKTLQNWKALLSTTLPDGMYYELTYNGDKKEFYLDAYKKFDNVRIPG